MHIHPIIVAHDGCEQAPPHTYASVERGFDCGACMAEVDVRTTKDGVVILNHDSHISIDHTSIRIVELTYEELILLAAEGRLRFPYPGGKITRLEEILDLARIRGNFINIDIKEDRVIEPAARQVREMNMSDAVVFSGCELKRAARIKESFKDLQVMLNVSEKQYALASVDYSKFAQELLDDAKKACCCSININHRACREQFIDRAQAMFLPVSVWTVDDPEEMIRFIRWGVYSITTNKVRNLREVIRQEKFL